MAIKSPYAKYLSKPWWKYISTKAHQVAGFRCQRVINGRRCNRPSDQVHHKNYRNFWHEVPGRDIEALCGYCHMEMHGKKAANDNEQMSMFDIFHRKKDDDAA